MSKVEIILKKYVKELNENKESKKINEYEDLLSDEIENLVNIQDFYQLKLENIISIVEKVEFEEIEENKGIDGCISLIQKIIQETQKIHQKETILLLNSIHISRCSFNVDSCISILKEFETSEICFVLCDLLNPELVTRNYEEELSLKEKEIKKLQTELSNLKQKYLEYPPITAKPADYESDIFQAIEQNKFDSVRYLHETQNIDKEIKGNYDRTPLHYACEKGNLPIVKYLIEKQHVNILSRDKENNTPLHLACWYSGIDVVKYLIETQHIDKEIKGCNDYTPLHQACYKSNLPIIKYLIEKQNVNILSRDKYNNTPLDIAKENNKESVIQYLHQIGNN